MDAGQIPGGDLLSQDLSSQYHRRCSVSLPGSEWDRVVPPRSGHQRAALLSIDFPSIRAGTLAVERPPWYSVCLSSCRLLSGACGLAGRLPLPDIHTEIILPLIFHNLNSFTLSRARSLGLNKATSNGIKPDG